MARKPPHDPVQLGRSSPLSPAAASDRPLLRRRARLAGAGALPLAAAAMGAPDHRRPARTERLERRALHEGHRGEGIRARHERHPPQPAELRRHRTAVGRPVPLGPDRRPEVRGGRADRGRRPVVDCRRRLFTRRESRLEARRRVRRRGAPTDPRVRGGLADSRDSACASVRSSGARTCSTSGTSSAA